MPDTTIIAPVAADPIDRLTLGATDAREYSMCVGMFCGAVICTCMAEE